MDLLPKLPDDEPKCQPVNEIGADRSTPNRVVARVVNRLGSQERPVVERVIRKLNGLSVTLGEIDDWLDKGEAARASCLAAVGSVGTCALTLDHLDLLFAFERRARHDDGGT